MASDLAGALVDCTILVVAFLAARAGLIPEALFMGVLCSIAGARAAMLKRGGGGPKGGSGVVASSAALCVAVGVGAALFHSLGRHSSTV